MLAAGTSLHQAGRLEEAGQLYRRVLGDEPGHAEALHRLGLVEYQQGRYRTAIKLIGKAVASEGGVPAYHNNLGIALLDAGRAEEAAAACRRALELRPDYVEALHTLALALLATGRPEEAVAAAGKAAAQRPALSALHLALGRGLRALGRNEEAEAAFRRAVALDPGDAAAQGALGVVLKALGRSQEALDCLARAVALRPEIAEFQNNHALILNDLGRRAEALEGYGRALALNPGYAEAHYNRSIALRLLGRLEEALQDCDAALALRPDYAEAANNRGVVLGAMGRFADGLAQSRRAVDLAPSLRDAHFNLGLALLMLGEFEPGWREYEWRPDGWETRRRIPELSRLPEWTGEPLDGRPLWIAAEQGIGDQIMFGSLVSELAERTIPCLLECEPRLAPLLARSLPDGVTALPAGEVAGRAAAMAGQAGAWCRLGSLPSFLRPTRASFDGRGAGWLKADPLRVAELRERYRSGGGLVVGLSWHSASPLTGTARSVTLAQLAPALMLPGVTFVSLQYGDHRAAIAEARQTLGVGIVEDDTVDPMGDLDTFAAQVAAMDLVITIDNSTAHFAGALGVPAWVLLPETADWRWLAGGERSVWWQSLRLFRRRPGGGWDEVVADVAAALGDMLASPAGPGGGVRDVEGLLAVALSSHQAGRLEQAAAEYRRVLDIEPDHAEALHRLGVLSYQQGRHDVAIGLISRAVALDGGVAAYHNNLAIALLDAGQSEEAATACRRALGLRPDYVEALHTLAEALLALGQAEEAVAVAGRGAALRPDLVALHLALGNGSKALGRLEEAEAAFRRASALDPRNADILVALGLVLKKQGRLDLARDSLGRALDLAPGRAELHNVHALFLNELGRRDEALAGFQRAVELTPSLAEAHCSRSTVLRNLGRLDEALEACDAALAHRPAYPEAHYNRSVILRLLGRPEESLEACDAALALRPDLAEAHNNRGLALGDLGRAGEAMAACRQALALDPQLRDAHLNLGIGLLALGDFAAGWPEYDWRPDGLGIKAGAPALARLPHWRGEDLGGRRLWITTEQGVGDELLYASLVPELVARDIPCILECHHRLLPLMARSLPVSVTLVARQEVAERAPELAGEAAAWCRLGSLPRFLRPSLKSFAGRGQGWMKPDPGRREELRARYCAQGGLVVGLSWHSAGLRTGPQRSLTLAQLAPVLTLPGLTFVSLQYGDHHAAIAEARQTLGVGIIEDATVDSLGGLDDFAAQVAAMDLVITIDNSTAHVAGALGVPAWVLLPEMPEWRWLAEGERSVWWQSLRLFRRRRGGGWDEVVAEVAAALGRLRPSPAGAGGGVRDVEGLLAAAVASHQAGRLEQAAAEYRRVLHVEPDHAEALHRLGVLNYQQGRHDVAIGLIGRAVALDGGVAAYHNNLAIALLDAGRSEEAATACRRALGLRPDYVEALHTLAEALLASGQAEEAAAVAGRAAALRPEMAEPHHARGKALQALGRLEAALEAFDRAVAVDESAVGVRFSRVLLLLQLGDFGRGWPEYEWRHQVPGLRRNTEPFVHLPAWDGQVRPALRLLVTAEQGIGDELLFGSLAVELAAGEVRLTLECSRRLMALFSRSVPDQVALVAREDLRGDTANLPDEIDSWCPAGSLGRFLRPDRASFDGRGAGWLKADPALVSQLKARYRARGGLVIGLSWHSASPLTGAARSVTLAQLAPLLKTPGVTFVSLQYGDHRAAIVEARETLGVGIVEDDAVDPMGDLDPFAAQVAAMDLVITVDNSTAHFAGALGVPAWVLLPEVPDWRWLAEGDRSVWWRSPRLFRRRSEGSWDDVVARVAAALADRLVGASSLHSQGLAALREGNPELAAGLIGRAAAVDGGVATYHNNHAAALHRLGRFDEAAAACRCALDLRPDYAMAHNNLGSALRGVERFDEAAAAFERAAALDPAYADAIANLAVVLLPLGRPEEAEAACRRALALRPDHFAASQTLAAALVEMSRFDEAEAAWRRTLDIAPAAAEAHFGLSLLLLLRGKWQEGRQEYEWRRLVPDMRRYTDPFAHLPAWRGEDPAGRRLLITAEQGIGDEIAFAALTTEAAARAGDCTVECDRRLVPLLARSLPAGVAVVAKDDLRAAPPRDGRLWCAMGSLPAVLWPAHAGGRGPAGGWLRADPAAVAELRRKYSDGRMLVGITWWSRHPLQGRKVSAPLAEWLPVLGVEGVRFVSLQYGDRRAEMDEAARAAGIDILADEAIDPLADMEGAAAQVAAMDLVIAIDNTTAALAGALGRPVWTLLATVPDWRMGLSGDSVDWYPAMRLFRQTRRGDWGEVMERVAEALRRQVASRPDEGAERLHALGIHAYREGRTAEAAGLFGRAVALDPGHPAYQTNLANALLGCGRVEEAAAAYRRALALDPGHAVAFNNLGAALWHLGRAGEALESWERACALKPDYADAHFGRGLALDAAGRGDEALEACRRATAADPRHARAFNTLAVGLKKRGLLDEALDACGRALNAMPDSVDALGNRGTLLLALGRPEEAAADFARAAALRPDAAAHHRHLGIALNDAGRPEEAVVALRRAMTLQPGEPRNAYNLGVALKSLGRVREAAEAYRRCIALDPSAVDAHFNLGLQLLMLGAFAEGWVEYEWRREGGEVTEANPAIGRLPDWTGGPVAGGRLLITAEQGVGDEVLFGSLVPELAAQGVPCLLECDRRLSGLFARSLPEGVALVTKDEVRQGGLVPPEAVARVRLGSLPRLLRGSRSAFKGHGQGWLKPDPDRVARCRARYGGGLVVGLSWHSVNARTGRQRSATLEQLAPVLETPGLTFVSLQYGDHGAELAAWREARGITIAEDPEVDARQDIEGFAAQVAAMDLVITIDNSTAHFAGALGVPAWVLLPAVPDWRWLAEGETSLWWRSLRLFRQSRAGEWDDVVARAAAALAHRRALQAGRDAPPGEVIGLFRRAVALDCGVPAYHNNLANALLGAGCLDEAVAAYRRALEVDPRYARACTNLGLALQGLGRNDEALAAWERGVALAPDDPSAINGLAGGLLSAGRLEEAAAACRRALEVRPAFPDAWNNLGAALAQLGRRDEAVAAYGKALASGPERAEILDNLGAALNGLGRFDEGLAACRRAVALAPGYAKAHNNIGSSLNGLGRIREAVVAFRKAVALAPDLALAHCNLGLNRLLLGEFAEGWAEYEWRREGHEAREANPGLAALPVWTGAALPEGRLLVTAEQGVGDEVLFGSLIPELAARGIPCLLECDRRLVSLFARSLPEGVALVDTDGLRGGRDVPRDAAAWIRAGSLPRLLRRTRAAFRKHGQGWLKADPARVAQYRAAEAGGLVVGLSWHSVNGRTGRQRSLRLDQLAPVLKSPGITFVSLQYGDHDAELAAVREGLGVQVGRDAQGDPLDDLDAFAARLAATDLVITIDNSTAHFAGALGVPACVLLPTVPDWRWQAKGDTCLWWQSLRLFRQSRAGEWGDVVERVRVFLREQGCRNGTARGKA